MNRSKFNPENGWTIDEFLTHVDIQYEDLVDIRRYQELKGKSYLTPVEQTELTNITNKHRNKIWMSEDLNKIQDCMVQLQRFFRDNTIPQLEQFKGELRAERDSAVVVINDEEAKALAELARLMEEYTQIVVDGKHTHVPNEIIGIANVAKTGSYNDLIDKPDVSASGHKHNFEDIQNRPTTYPPASHDHDGRYYTETEVDTKLSGKSNTGHTHDDRYYTESEMNVKLNSKSNTDHKHNIADVTGLQGEIDGLKSSVVSGKQEVVNAINDKAGYNTGLTTNNTHSDYAWHIRNSINNSNKVVATERALGMLSYGESGKFSHTTKVTGLRSEKGEFKTYNINNPYFIVGGYNGSLGYDFTFTVSNATLMHTLYHMNNSSSKEYVYKNNGGAVINYGSQSSVIEISLIEQLTDATMNWIIGL